MMGGGFGRGMNDSLKQNREPLTREKRSFFKKQPIISKDAGKEKDHKLSPEEMQALKLKLRSDARRARIRDFMILTGVLTALGIGLVISLYLAGMLY